MKKIFIFLVVMLLTSPLIADEAALIYKDEGKRDPFVSLVSGEGKLTVHYGVINSISDVKLEGILYDKGGKSTVILNDLVLKENDHVGAIRVRKIEQDRVTLEFENEEYVFKLKE